MRLSPHILLRAAAVVLLGLGTLACASGGGEGFDHRSLPARTVSGEITEVDAEAQELRVRSDEDETFTVGYTAETYVFYQGERAAVDALEPGDVVVVHLRQEEGSDVHADWVDVQQSIQERERALAPDQIEGEVVQVATAARELLLSTRQGAQRLSWSDATTVVYKDETHPVTALDPGDLVVVTTAPAGAGLRSAERIEVVRSVQERSGGATPGEREPITVTGRVDALDRRTGELLVRTSEGMLRVRVPFNTDAMTRRVLERLRRDQTVRMVVIPLGEGVAELVRFD